MTTNSLKKCWHILLSGNSPFPTQQDYQGISSMLTQIDGEIHTNVAMNQWVENAGNRIEDCDPNYEAMSEWSRYPVKKLGWNKIFDIEIAMGWRE